MEEIKELIDLREDGNISACELAEALISKGYEIEIPQKNEILFSDFVYHGKKLDDITMSRSPVSYFLEEPKASFHLIFL